MKITWIAKLPGLGGELSLLQGWSSGQALIEPGLKAEELTQAQAMKATKQTTVPQMGDMVIVMTSTLHGITTPSTEPWARPC